MAAAVGPELTYVKVRQGDEVFYLSQGHAAHAAGAVRGLGELKGAELVGWTYDGPFDDLAAAAGGSPPGAADPRRQAVPSRPTG